MKSIHLVKLLNCAAKTDASQKLIDYLTGSSLQDWSDCDQDLDTHVEEKITNLSQSQVFLFYSQWMIIFKNLDI